MDAGKRLEEENREELTERKEALQPETFMRNNEMEQNWNITTDETVKTREELIRVSGDLERANETIRQLQSDLSRAVAEIEELKDRLKSANESQVKLEKEVRKEQDEKERLKEALPEARGFCADSSEATFSEYLQSVEVTKTNENAVSDDCFETNYIGGFRTTDAEVKGVARLESFIYVLYQSSVEGSHIRVYHDKTMAFELNKVIKLPECLKADDLAAHSEAQCLYVTDSIDMFPVVWMVTQEDDRVTEWNAYSMNLNFTLSVSLFGHVLVHYNYYEDHASYLDVCLSNARKLYTLQLPYEEFGIPLAVVETSKRNLIISYQNRFNSNEMSSCICEMTADARIIRRFSPGDDPSHRLNNPRYLFVDSWDRVIVADSGSNRVILLDRKLNWNGVLLKRDFSVRDDYSRPFLYDSSTQLMFIGPRYEEIQQVDIYSLKLRPPDDEESKEDPNYQMLPLACAQVNQLPDVVLERILLKACLLPLVISDGKSNSLTTKDLLALAAVDHSWYQHLKKNRLYQLIKRKLAARNRIAYYRKHTIRNNQKYFIENIEPETKVVQLQEEGAPPRRDRDLIDRLHDAKCLSDRQRRLLRRLSQRPRDMNYELMKITRSYDVMHYATFVECLRQTKQLIPADVLERGGVTVEVKVILRKQFKRFTEEVISTINILRDKKFPQKKEVEELISQLMVNDIEILGAQKLNKATVVVWLWCRSQESLFRLRELNLPIGHLPSLLFDITEKLFKAISQTIFLKAVTIEEKQLLQDVAVCPIPIQISTIPNVRGIEFRGVVKHRNKICVLSQKPKLIQVFDDQHPFDLVRDVEIKKIQNPSDMTAGPDCLYIKESFFDKKKNENVFYIAKVSFESGSFVQFQDLRWLSDPTGTFWLSICRDGKLLLTRQGQPPTLEIYGCNESNSKEAILVYSVKFNKDFSILQHAVETQFGNFVISYRLVNNPKCSIAEVNRSGHIVRLFTAPNELLQVENPYHLALDTYGRVFAADYDGNRVVMLDSQLNWIQVILSFAKDGLELPGHLWYDEEKKQLISAQSFGRKDRSSTSKRTTMEPAIYVVDIPAFSMTV